MTILRTHDHEDASPFGYSSLVGTAPTVTTVNPPHGARAISLSAATSYVSDTGLTGLTTVSFYARWASITAVSNFAYLLNASGGFVAFLQVQANGQVRLKNAAGTNLYLAPSNLVAGTTYRVELQARGNNTAALRVYVGDSTTALYDSGDVANSGTPGGTPATGFRLGNVASSALPITLDSVQAADTWTGPYAPPVAAGPTVWVKQADGSLVQAAFVGVWNGAAVVPAAVTVT